MKAAPRLRCSTLNLHNFTAPPFASYEFDNIYSQAQWQQKTRWLSVLLQQQQPDIVAFQEVFSLAELQQLVQQHGYHQLVHAGTPELIDQHFFSRPVVALASRLPILSAVEVPVPLAAKLLQQPDFAFSRTPLRVTIDIPELGPCQCYVVHFKSRRPVETEPATPVLSQHLPRWAATVQRGHEAALLMEAILQQRKVDGLPVMVLGDFNDELSADALQLLLKPHSLGHDSFQLQDAWQLWPAAPASRPASHYYGAKGSVLDYILLSDEFDGRCSQAVAQVQAVDVYDRHLRQPNFNLDGYSSDHAMVTVHLQRLQSQAITNF